MSTHSNGLPPIVTGAGNLLQSYDVVFCDVWGVVHNGRAAYPAAGAALASFRARGGTVVLLSNAPMPEPDVARLLDDRRVRRDAWDALVTSGDITRAHLEAQRFSAVHHIGPDRDLGVFEGLPIRRVPLAEAQAIVCTGLDDDRNETGETYRPLLAEALARRLPMVCANPDLVVDVDGVLLPCAGAIAAIYEEMGGDVYWAGKPYAPAYEMALRTAERLRSKPVLRGRILAIGDAPRTDIAGAIAFGIDALLIAHGIHREDLMPAGTLLPERVARLLAPPAPRPVAVMPELAW
jgi:HAD superfamily hydrolase (TIGR01459 family)